MSNKHTQYYGKCAIPGAVGDADYSDLDETAPECRVIINGPPEDGQCSICRRQNSDLDPYGGAGDPCVGDFSGMKLVKQFREDLPGYASPSWECRDCIQRPGGLWEIRKEDQLGRELTLEERRKLRANMEQELDAMHQETE